MIFSVFAKHDSAKEQVNASWGTLRWLASQEVGNVKGLTLGHVTIRVGKANPRHFHQSEEVLYLLQGKLEHSAGDSKVILEAGDTIAIAAGVPHNAINIGDVDAEMIVAFSTGVRDFTLEAPQSADALEEA